MIPEGLTKTSYYHQLFDWKESICPDCENRDICPQLMTQVKNCLNEELLDVTDPIDELLGTTLRRMCRLERRKRRDMQAEQREEKSWRTVWGNYRKSSNKSTASSPTYPVDKKAVLVCSDLEEYDAWQQPISGYQTG